MILDRNRHIQRARPRQKSSIHRYPVQGSLCKARQSEARFSMKCNVRTLRRSSPFPPPSSAEPLFPKHLHETSDQGPVHCTTPCPSVAPRDGGVRSRRTGHPFVPSRRCVPVWKGHQGCRIAARRLGREKRKDRWWRGGPRRTSLARFTLALFWPPHALAIFSSRILGDGACMEVLCWVRARDDGHSTARMNT